MLCVSIAEPDYESCLDSLKNVEMAEIRLDLIPVNEEKIKQIFLKNVRLIATCRPDNMERGHRIFYLKTAIEAGAAFVDIEIETPQAEKEMLVEFAKAHNCKIIISYHNFEKTPDSCELKKIVDDCFAQGADIAKLACLVNSNADAARVLSLYDDERPIVSLGMGSKGKITRVAAILLGAPFTFVSNLGRKTAPGQIDMGKMNSILNLIQQD